MSKETAGGFSAEERTAMKERAAELKSQGKAADKAAAAEAEMLAKIAKMPDGDRQMAERLHSIVTAVAPHLSPKLYYGQPAYARDGKVVVFFRSGQMDKERYSTFGVTQHAALDDASGLWATSYALAEPTEEAWTQLTMIVKQAAEHA